MTRKDYELIAEVIRKLKLVGDESIREHVASDMAFALQSTNPLFDRVRFLRACGVQ